MTAQEIVDQINSMDLWSPGILEDVLADAGFDRGFVTEVAKLSYDEHRWYTLATVVFQVGSEFFGVRGPVTLKSEYMGYEDVGFRCSAFLMDAVPSVTYKRRNVPTQEQSHVLP